ncbi:MAG: immunoglobulin-like domain-containing protein [Bacteroidia bacterium]
MKKQILSVAAAVLLIGAVTLVGCSKADTTAPVITLTGDAAVTINLHDTYADAGATATDDKDGNITTTIATSNPVNADQCGNYTVSYSVSDKAGNAATVVTRIVTVKSDNLAGTYAVHDVVTGATPSTNNGTFDYAVVVTQSSTDNDKIILSNFGGFGATSSVYANVNGTAITVPSQTCMATGAVVTVSGTGTYNVTGAGVAGAKIAQITYSATGGLGNGSATYTKQ